MHARIDQLLSLRDGEPVDASISEHVAACSSCAAKLAQIATTREHLLSLPMLDPPQELWAEISQRISHDGARRSKVRPVWIAASAAAVALLVAIAFLHSPRSASIALQPTNNASGSELTALVERSQQLEAALELLPQRPSVERVATAANIDGIEQRIQWLDFHLTAANDSLDQAQTQQLWQERVNLMDSLVKLRYAEARTAQL
ncbi:MAG TPA: hypothetical protein VFS24_18570 [Steroidobacteraceae bacterium]|nr:hypothetical protein [Steroidobacteraceae bacterium]